MALNTLAQSRARERKSEKREREQNSALVGTRYEGSPRRPRLRGRREGLKSRGEGGRTKVRIQSSKGKQETCGALNRLID